MVRTLLATGTSSVCATQKGRTQHMNAVRGDALQIYVDAPSPDIMVDTADVNVIMGSTRGVLIKTWGCFKTTAVVVQRKQQHLHQQHQRQIQQWRQIQQREDLWLISISVNSNSLCSKKWIIQSPSLY